MDVHSSNLALVEPPPVESAVETIEWIHFSPLVIPTKKSALQVKVRIVQTGGTDSDVALTNLPLSSMFQQCDISLNQRTVNTSIGSNYPYKAYFDVLLNSNSNEAESI